MRTDAASRSSIIRSMNSRLPLYVQIQNYIRKGIETGRFAEGDRLPSEPELAQRFATTRATVAKAFQQLVFEGAISRRIGSGTFVGNGKIEDRVDTNSFGSFEDHVLAAGETLQYQLILFEPARATAEIAKHLELEAGAPVFRLERLRSVNGHVVALEVRFLPEAITKGIKQEWLETCTIQDILRDCLGLRIGRIDNAVSATTASAHIAKVLGTIKGKALLVREHTIFEPKGRPLLYGKALYQGDFSIRYTLRSPSV
jgi:GntR family transcriptional regulator